MQLWSSILAAALAMHLNPVDLLGLGDVRDGATLPNGWSVQAVRGERAPASMVANRDGIPVMQISGMGRAAWFVNKLENAIKPTPGALEWSWRVPVAPSGLDLRDMKRDDSALRVFVVFAPTSFLDRTPRTLFYSLGGAEPDNFERPSFQSRDLYVIRTGAAADAKDWVSVSMKPFEDYQRIWSGKPRNIVAVGLMQDTDQTGMNAVAEIRKLTWSSVQ